MLEMPPKRQTRKQRQSPTESATLFPEGTIRKGNNGRHWVVKKTTTGVPRWVLEETVTLHGFQKLTVDCMESMIGKEMAIYLREYTDVWPTKTTLEKKPSLRFIPNGDARVRKTIYTNWLHTRSPSIKPGQVFELMGTGFYDMGGKKVFEEMTLQVDSKNGHIVSPNLMNTEAFVNV
jgi:hypothetical protein